MAGWKDFREIAAWQHARALKIRVDGLMKKAEFNRLYRYRDQLSDAARSGPANIAEGFKRRGKPDKARQMNIAQSSLEELRYFFILCADLSYLPTNPVGDRLDEVARMLGAYTQAILDSRP